MIDKLVAADLAALAIDSQQRIGSLESFVPAPRVAVVRKPQVLDPVRTRVNRIAALAALGTATVCGVGLATTTFRGPFLYFGTVQNDIFENPWFLGFAAIALVAFAFLFAHRFAAHVLEAAAGWKIRASRSGDVAFGVAALAWAGGWFAVMVAGNSAWSLVFSAVRVEAIRGHVNDIRTDGWIALASGVAVSLTARAIAVASTRSVADRWSGSALALVAKLVGLTALIAIFAIPEYWITGVTSVSWFPHAPAAELVQRLSELQLAMFRVRFGWGFYQREWFDPAQLRFLIDAAIGLGGIAIVGILAVVERHTQRRSRILAILEHRAPLGVAVTIALVSLVAPGFMQPDRCPDPFYAAAAVSMIAIAVWTTLARRRATLTSSGAEP